MGGHAGQLLGGDHQQLTLRRLIDIDLDRSHLDAHVIDEQAISPLKRFKMLENEVLKRFQGCFRHRKSL